MKESKSKEDMDDRILKINSYCIRNFMSASNDTLSAII